MPGWQRCISDINLSPIKRNLLIISDAQLTESLKYKTEVVNGDALRPDELSRSSECHALKDFNFIYT